MIVNERLLRESGEGDHKKSTENEGNDDVNKGWEALLNSRQVGKRSS